MNNIHSTPLGSRPAVQLGPWGVLGAFLWSILAALPCRAKPQNSKRPGGTPLHDLSDPPQGSREWGRGMCSIGKLGQEDSEADGRRLILVGFEAMPYRQRRMELYHL